MQAALIVMPFGAADRPSLAAGLLQAGLKSRGISCETKYFNLSFARLLGESTYRALAESGNMTVLAGEWIFSQVFYGRALSDWERYEREVLRHPIWGGSRAQGSAIREALTLAPAFIEMAFAADDWSRFDLIGFSSTFEQTFASFCLARRIKQAFPQVALAFGGANFQSTLATAYIENFEFIDFVATGEADESFPELCANLEAAATGVVAEAVVPEGFLFRRDGKIQGQPEARGLTRLDEIATPDYRDFFSVGGAATSPWLPIEASRGCWWGQKSHCSFCGLNGETMAFRRKSWQRVAAETAELERDYGAWPLQFADNILATQYFDDLLPHWAAQGSSVAKFFEIKSNLKRRQVLMLRAAGVSSVQAGVESLLDGTLSLMGKGVKAIQNVALLRWCAEANVAAIWNLLFGFPGEDQAGYDETLALANLLTHLPAPSGFGLIRLDRFSPNFFDATARGFSAVAPLPAYRHVFGLEPADLERVAYFFDYHHDGIEPAMAACKRLAPLLRSWRDRSGQGTNGSLGLRLNGPEILLIDSRFNRDPRELELSPWALALLVICDAPILRRTALEKLERLGAGAPQAALELDLLLERGAILEINNQLLTLVFLPDDPELALAAELHDLPSLKRA